MTKAIWVAAMSAITKVCRQQAHNSPRFFPTHMSYVTACQHLSTYECARGRGRSSPLRFTHTLAAHRFWPWFWPARPVVNVNGVKLAPALRSHRAYELCQDSRLTHCKPRERIFVMLTKYR